MNQNCIRDSSVELLQTLGAHKELKILLPKEFVLFKLATTSVIKVHDAPLDAVVVSEICLDFLS